MCPVLALTRRGRGPAVRACPAAQQGAHRWSLVPRHAAGVTNNDACLHLRTAAINLRRLINLGLTDTGGGWALAS